MDHVARADSLEMMATSNVLPGEMLQLKSGAFRCAKGPNARKTFDFASSRRQSVRAQYSR